MRKRELVSKNEYYVPAEEKDIIRIRTDSPAHKGDLKHAMDFEMNEGKKILAALDGVVVHVKDDSNVGGPDKKYWHDGNRIVLRHENMEYTAYEHLKFRGALVKMGDRVKARQPLGLSGNTGYTFGPHLHFEVFRFLPGENPPDGRTETISVRFIDLK